MPIWPETLPQVPLQDSYSENPPNVLIRTQMDVGPAKVRRRTTAGVRNFDVAFVMDADQVEILDSFFTSDCDYGADEFFIPKPRNPAVNIAVRFVEPPNYKALDQYFTVSMKLEALP